MVMDCYHAGNVFELGQKLDAGLIVFEPRHQIDMHEKGQILEMRVAKAVECLAQVGERAPLQKHGAGPRDQVAMGSRIPNNRDDTLSQAVIDRLSSHGQFANQKHNI